MTLFTLWTLTAPYGDATVAPLDMLDSGDGYDGYALSPSDHVLVLNPPPSSMLNKLTD